MVATTFPTRETAAATTGPRLAISPLELNERLRETHGLSNILLTAQSWETFAWKGQHLSSPLRALYSAENHGLLTRKPDGSAVNVPVAEILGDVNAYLEAIGKASISENAILSALSTASRYISAAVGVALIPDRTNMCVRLVDKFETAENLERYFEQMRPKLVKLQRDAEHAKAMGFDVSHILTGHEYAGPLMAGHGLLSAAD